MLQVGPGLPLIVRFSFTPAYVGHTIADKRQPCWNLRPVGRPRVDLAWRERAGEDHPDLARAGRRWGARRRPRLKPAARRHGPACAPRVWASIPSPRIGGSGLSRSMKKGYGPSAPAAAWAPGEPPCGF